MHMLKKKENPQYTIDFSIAASVLKLMIQHDFNIVTEEDIIRVMKSNDINLQYAISKHHALQADLTAIHRLIQLPYLFY